MKKLTEKQFNAAVSKTKMHSKTKNIAKDILVNQNKILVVAEKYDVYRQFVEATVKRVYVRHLENLKAPSGWIEISVFLPPKRAKEIEKEARRLSKEYYIGQRKVNHTKK